MKIISMKINKEIHMDSYAIYGKENTVQEKQV